MTPYATPLLDRSPATLGVPFDPTACPACRAPLESLGFCPRDGAIGREGRFVVATHYVAEELLGAGERSFVYAGHRAGKPIAIKLLRDADTSSSSAATRKFLREARNASQLVHDNTIAIHEFGQDEALGVPFIAMELFSGQSLERVLRTSGAMTVARTISILVQVARSLANAHMAGVLHREVTARSVLVGRGDVVKLGDYGLGRADDASGSEADVLGFGRLAVAMLRGRAPAVPQAMLDKVSTSIPAELHRVLAQCLDPSVSARPRAAELEERLLAVGTQPFAAPPIVAAPPVVAPTPVVVAPPPPVMAAPPPVMAAPPPVMAAPPPVMVAPPPVAIVEPVAVAIPAVEPAPVDELLDAEPSASWRRPSRRGWWIAGIAVAAATMVALVVYAAASHTSTADRTEHALTPSPAPIASASPKREPEHLIVHEPPPPPPPAPPTPPPAAPDPAPAPAAKPSVVATPPAPPPIKKPKHKDDAVIADPFSD
jgi:predicted Ser/Thr protein kinase